MIVYKAEYGRKRVMTLVFILGLLSGLYAQSSSVSIRATAIVTNITEIELVTISNLYIDDSYAKNGIVHIAPISDAAAGKIMIKGEPDAVMHITFINQLALVNTNGKGSLVFNYEISGYSSDNQQASQLLDAIERSLKFNSQGEYYLWIGGRADISNVSPGKYEGEFTLEIEYM